MSSSRVVPMTTRWPWQRRLDAKREREARTAERRQAQIVRERMLSLLGPDTLWQCSCGNWNGLWPWCGSCSLFRWNQPEPVVYVAQVWRQEPETRWFHRRVLRRRFRLVLLHAGVCDSFSLEQNLNQISNATVVLRDPAGDIARRVG